MVRLFVYGYISYNNQRQLKLIGSIHNYSKILVLLNFSLAKFINHSYASMLLWGKM